MGCALGDAGGGRLDVLVTLIDAYESEHDPIDPPDPSLAFRLKN
jgi:HTH-type transcriptional regulator / antitoxin HigA